MIKKNWRRHTSDGTVKLLVHNIQMSVSKKAPTYLKVSQVLFAYEHNILSVSIGVQLASTSEIVALHIQSVSNCVASYFVSEVLGLHIKSVSNAVASSFVSDVVPLHIQSVSNGV